MILSFELTMPNIGSWNGKWSGQDQKYYLHKTVSNQIAEKILSGEEKQNFYYNFGDGWGANITVEKVDSLEKRKREKVSKGFCRYGWMVESIIKNNKIIS